MGLRPRWSARLAGEVDEGHQDVRALAARADRDGLDKLTLSEKATVVSFRAMNHLGFVGIMLLASVCEQGRRVTASAR